MYDDVYSIGNDCGPHDGSEMSCDCRFGFSEPRVEATTLSRSCNDNVNGDQLTGCKEYPTAKRILHTSIWLLTHER